MARDPMKAFKQPYDELLVDPRWPTVAKGYEFRIEALRAASRVVAGIYAGQDLQDKSFVDFLGNGMASTRELAEQFARWLEDGKR